MVWPKLVLNNKRRMESLDNCHYKIDNITSMDILGEINQYNDTDMTKLRGDWDLERATTKRAENLENLNREIGSAIHESLIVHFALRETSPTLENDAYLDGCIQELFSLLIKYSPRSYASVYYDFLIDIMNDANSRFSSLVSRGTSQCISDVFEKYYKELLKYPNTSIQFHRKFYKRILHEPLGEFDKQFIEMTESTVDQYKRIIGRINPNWIDYVKKSH